MTGQGGQAIGYLLEELTGGIDLDDFHVRWLRTEDCQPTRSFLSLLGPVVKANHDDDHFVEGFYLLWPFVSRKRRIDMAQVLAVVEGTICLRQELLK